MKTSSLAHYQKLLLTYFSLPGWPCCTLARMLCVLNRHRGETRGLGGIFFDDLNDRDPETIFKWSEECCNAVPDAYLPIINVCLPPSFPQHPPSTLHTQ